MYPNIRYGDMVILKKKTPARGNVVCYRDESEQMVIHRIVAERDGYFITKGDNCFCCDNPIEKEKIMAVAVAIHKDRVVFPIKGKWLYGYFYFFSILAILVRNCLKNIFLMFSDWKIYHRLTKRVLPFKDIEIIKTAETEKFYFFKAKVNGKEAGFLKYDKKTQIIRDLYVKIIYKKLGIEDELKKYVQIHRGN